MKNTNSICWRHKTATSFSHLVAEIVFVFLIVYLTGSSSYLFMNNGKRIRENTFNKRLSSICDILKIDHRSTHKIRKTYGTTLLDNNVDDSIVSEQMGHSDIATTRKLYYFCNKSEKTKIVQINNAINF